MSDSIEEIKKKINEIKDETAPIEGPKAEVAAAIKEANQKRQKELTDGQKAIVLNKVNENPKKFPKINDLAKLLFPDEPNADGRSWHGILIKSYLAKLNIKTVGAHVYVPEKEIELTDAQKEYIVNNISPNVGVLQLARDIFQNQNLTNLHAEVRVVIAFVETLPPQVLNKTEFDKIPKGMYKPPGTINTVIWKINSYFNDQSGGLNKDKLSNKQLKGLEAVIGYINTYRFIHQINSFDLEDDRKLFESTFLRHCYDKPDLTQEEVDQYIMVATETVNMTKAWSRKEKLQKLMEDASDSDQDDKINITMRLVEAIGKSESAYDDCQGRLNDLLDSLKVKRSKRLEQKIQENASILNLVEAWKAKETRDQIIKVVEKQRESLENEIERLSNMEEIKCRILGLGKNEILDG